MFSMLFRVMGLLLLVLASVGCLEKKSDASSDDHLLVERDADEARQQRSGSPKKEDGASKAVNAPSHPEPQSVVAEGELLLESKLSDNIQEMVVVSAEPGAAGEAYFDDVVEEGAEYNRIEVSGFKDVLDAPLSTFSIDLDTASYANTRSILNRGSLPPRDAVRIEEMINYFRYNYAPPAQGEGPFAIHHEAAPCPWNPEAHLLLVGLKGREVARGKMPPANLVFLIDVSGSMNSPEKLGLLKTGFYKLIAQLRPQDSVSVVTYAGSDRVLLEGVGGDQKRKLKFAVTQLAAGGGTAGAAGIKTAYEIAHRNWIPEGNNRIILATDGDFNIGISSQSELLRMIEEERGKGIFMSVLGFGSGRYMEGQMEQIANHGDGNYSFIDTVQEAHKVLVDDMAGTLLTIAKDVKIQVEFNPAKVASYRLIGYENRALNNEDFEDDQKDAGELGAGHTVTALYEVVFTDQVSVLPEKPLKYQERVLIEADGKEWTTVSLRYKLPEGEVSQLTESVVSDAVLRQPAENLRLAATVAEFGLRLRKDPVANTAPFAELAQRLNGYLHDPMIKELQELMVTASETEADFLSYQDE